MGTLLVFGVVYLVVLFALAMTISAYIAKCHPDQYKKMVERDEAVKRQAIDTAKKTAPVLLKTAIRFLLK